MADTRKKQASAVGARRKSRPTHGERSSVVQGTALVALHSMTSVEMTRMSKALETEGIKDVKPARIILSRTDAKRVASGSAPAIRGTVVAGESVEATVGEAPEPTLDQALKDARARGKAV